MAKRTQVIMVDDLDGEEMDSAGKTISFAHGGNAYEIDLTESNAKKLQEALAPYVAAARRVGNRRSAVSTEKPDLPAMRAWAKERGIKVSERGRVSQDVQDAYRAAH
ncbi:MAG: Lsr2 family protein [Propionibacteriaceae bacterium]